MRPEIVYHGGGYVGLTGAVAFAAAGHATLIYDPSQAVVDAINAGVPKANELVGYLADTVKQLVQAQLLRATTEWNDERMRRTLTHVIAVPTERDGYPTMEGVDNVVVRVMDVLGDAPWPVDDAIHAPLVIIESTLTPGTTRRLGMLVKNKGIRVGDGGIGLVAAPRRDWLADPEKNVTTLPRIVGGLTPSCTARGVACLGQVSRTIHPTDATTAEMVKATENANLHVQVMMAHELAAAFPEVDVAETMRLVATHWRMIPLHLNLGSGGRCVPLGARYLLDAGGPLPLLRAALVIDDEFAEHVVQAVERRTKRRAYVAVLGIGYRADFRDRGNSPGLRTAKALQTGFHVAVHDPLYAPSEIEALGFRAMELDALPSYDAVILATPHTAYNVLPALTTWSRGQFVLDAQGVWRAHRALLTERGVVYRCVGDPGWIRRQHGEG